MAGLKTTSKFVQWSEEHGIPRGPTTLAILKLLPTKFQIEGPPDLVGMTQAIAAMMQDQDSEALKFMMYSDVWSGYHVICSVSGQEILLCDLRYWDVSGLIYASPYLIPGNAKPEPRAK
jgi:hypothetical protein